MSYQKYNDSTSTSCVHKNCIIETTLRLQNGKKYLKIKIIQIALFIYINSMYNWPSNNSLGTSLLGKKKRAKRMHILFFFFSFFVKGMHITTPAY